MADVKIQLTQGQRMRDRMGRLRKKHQRPGLRVEPKNEALRKVLKHVPSGIGFRSEGSVEWPDDSFTRRRIRDGDVKIVDEKKVSPKPHAASA